MDGIEDLFEEQQDREWRDHIEAVASEIADADDEGAL
jgi:hypothetical protein